VAHENKVSYLEWGLQDAKASFFHWEFLGERELHNGINCYCNTRTVLTALRIRAFFFFATFCFVSKVPVHSSCLTPCTFISTCIRSLFALYARTCTHSRLPAHKHPPPPPTHTNTPSGKQAVLDRGSPRGGAEVYTFWINQDIIVPVDEYVKLIQQAVTKTGTLNPAILA